MAAPTLAGGGNWAAGLAMFAATKAAFALWEFGMRLSYEG